MRDVAAPLTHPMHAAALLRPAVSWVHPARRWWEHPLLERASQYAGVVQAMGVMKRVQVVPEVTAAMRAVRHLSVLRGTYGPVVAVGVITNG